MINILVRRGDEILIKYLPARTGPESLFDIVQISISSALTFAVRVVFREDVAKYCA